MIGTLTREWHCITSILLRHSRAMDWFRDFTAWLSSERYSPVDQILLQITSLSVMSSAVAKWPMFTSDMP